jgi:hypothetical protein
MALMHLWRRPTGPPTADLHFYLGVRADQNQWPQYTAPSPNRGPEIGASRAPDLRGTRAGDTTQDWFRLQPRSRWTDNEKKL